MKTSMNFYAPIWLLVLGLAFGLWGCDETPTIEDSVEGEYKSLIPLSFCLVNEQFYNIIPTSENSVYNLKNIYVQMEDGYIVEDFKYTNRYTDLPHRANVGFVFQSDFLGEIAFYEKHVQYRDKPFYVVWNSTDTDTLLWNSKEKKLYANGNICLTDIGAPYMIKKGGY